MNNAKSRKPDEYPALGIAGRGAPRLPAGAITVLAGEPSTSAGEDAGFTEGSAESITGGSRQGAGTQRCCRGNCGRDTRPSWGEELSLRSVASEVAVQRMLLATFLQPALRKAVEDIRYGKEFPSGMVDRRTARLGEISKTAMRLARIEGLSALTQEDLQILEMTVVDLFMKYIEDDKKRLQAVNELAWRLGRVAQERQERSLLAEVEGE